MLGRELRAIRTAIARVIRVDRIISFIAMVFFCSASTAINIAQIVKVYVIKLASAY